MLTSYILVSKALLFIPKHFLEEFFIGFLRMSLVIAEMLLFCDRALEQRKCCSFVTERSQIRVVKIAYLQCKSKAAYDRRFPPPFEPHKAGSLIGLGLSFFFHKLFVVGCIKFGLPIKICISILDSLVNILF